MRPVATDVGRSAVRVLDTRVKLLIKYHQHIIKRPFRYVFSKQICDMHVIINSAMCHSLITNMSVLLIVVWKCTLAASHAAPSPVSHGEYVDERNRRTEDAPSCVCFPSKALSSNASLPCVTGCVDAVVLPIVRRSDREHFFVRKEERLSIFLTPKYQNLWMNNKVRGD